VSVYTVNQRKDVESFLGDKGLDGVPLRNNPMPNRKLIRDDSEISANLESWCKSVIGGLHCFARGTRWDISQAVSRISQTLRKPNRGTVKSIEWLAGYMKNTVGFSLEGLVNPSADALLCVCDSNHHGDLGFTFKSQSGVIILLNGVPVHWRSNRQPKTTLSPVESEVYALSVGIKDARLMGWVLEDCGVKVEWPLVIHTDSLGAESFKSDTCPYSKLRGCFSYRWDWIVELREAGDVRTAHISDSDNLADIFTKCLTTKQFSQRVYQIQKMSGV